MRILFLGDVVGRVGRIAIEKCLTELKSSYAADIVVANGENSAGGFGISKKTYQELSRSGVDFITGGNHSWKQPDVNQFYLEKDNLIRPANFGSKLPGKGFGQIEVQSSGPLAVVNLHGRIFFDSPIDCPFKLMEKFLSEELSSAKNILVDFHGEASSEKIAFARHFDGRVSAVVGTHTHVQTADEVVLSGGTAFITDAGMCGPSEGIIGMQAEPVIEKFLNGIGPRFEAATGAGQINGVLIELSSETGKAKSIERIFKRL